MEWLYLAQCGNYGNLLSRLFERNFVKATFQTKGVTKMLISRNIFSVRVNFSIFHTVLYLDLMARVRPTQVERFRTHKACKMAHPTFVVQESMGRQELVI